MKIHAKGERAREVRSFLQHVAPGAEIEGQDGPAEWWDEQGNPITFPVHFQNGVAEVADPLGRFMLERGYAQRTALILPSFLDRLAA